MAVREFADISDYQERFDAGRYAAAGHLLVAIKATEGTSGLQSKYAERVAAAHGRGLGVWHYHFAHPDTDPGEGGEASHFWTNVRPHFHAGDRLVLDVELRHPGGPAGLIAYTSTLDARLLHISGQASILYTYDALLRETGPKFRTKSGEVWLAKYGGWVWPLGGGRRMIARQYTDGEAGGDPKRYAGIGQCDGDRLQRWYFRQLLRERRRRGKS